MPGTVHVAYIQRTSGEVAETQCPCFKYNSRAESFHTSASLSIHRTLDLHLWGPRMKKLRNSLRLVFKGQELRPSFVFPRPAFRVVGGSVLYIPRGAVLGIRWF